MNKTLEMIKFIIITKWEFFYILGVIILASTSSSIIKNREHQSKFSLRAYIGDLVIAGFTGYCFFLACREFNFSDNWTFLVVAISSHAGVKALKQLDILILEKITKKINDK